jgi:hypothetical protein
VKIPGSACILSIFASPIGNMTPSTSNTFKKISAFLFFLSGIFTTVIHAQTIGDYRSGASPMNWSSTTQWQTWNGTAWTATTTPPAIIASGKTVTIQSGHVVTNNITTVSNSGTIVITGTLTNAMSAFTNNAGGTITINGTLTNNSSRIITNNGTVDNAGVLINHGTLNNNLYLNINSNANVSSTGTLNNSGTITIASTKTLTNAGALANNGTIDNAGTLAQNNIFTNASSGTINNSGTLTILTAKTLTNNGIINNLSAGILNINTATTGTGKLINSGTIDNAGIISNPTTVVTVNYFLNNSGSFLINSGTIQNSLVTAMKFNAGSTYKHNYSSSLALPSSGYILPYATYDPASTCEILSFGNGTVSPTSSTIPTTLSLGNVIWNNSSQPANINMNGALKTITGSFTIQNTNGFSLILKSTTGNNLTITGDLNIHTAVKLVLTNGGTNFGSSSCILTMNNFNMTGGSLDMTQSVFTSGTGGTGTMQIKGSFAHTAGTIIKTGTQNAAFSMIGTSTQTMESIGFNTGTAFTFNTQTGTAGNCSIASGKTFVVNSGTILNVNNNTSSTNNDLTVVGTLKVSGIINVLSGSGLNMTNSVMTDASAAGGIFNLNAGATLSSGHASGIWNTGSVGSIQVTGTRTFNNDANYTFNGTVAQITGNALPSVLTGSLTVNNSLGLASGGVTLSQTCFLDERSANALKLICGKFITSSSSLLILNDSSSTTPNGGSLVSFVDGPIKKIGFDVTEFVFPTGDSDKWARIGFTASALTTTDEFTAEYFKSNPKTAFDSTLNHTVVNRELNNISQLEYWNLERNAGTSIGKVKLYWEDNLFSGINSPSVTDLRVAHFYNPGTGLKWYGESNVSPFVTLTTSGSTGTLESFSDVSSFSPFTFGSRLLLNPLPIELLSFTGTSAETGNQLTWSTATEINNDYFVLERSVDANDFSQVAIVDGHGNSSSIIKYDYFDDKPVDGMNYYRLKQVDHNGNHSYSPIVSLSYGIPDESFIVAYPNPTSESTISILLSGNIKDIIIYNVLGEVVYYSSNIQQGEAITVDVLSIGVYIVKAATTDQQTITSRFVKN